MRLVMPPTLFFILQLPFTNLAHALFPASVANGLICGAFTAYICYDCFHYLCDPHPAPSFRWDVS
jgi:4-hydroxysphinganine ceramide fatty acyl 2-hydroxylase